MVRFMIRKEVVYMNDDGFGFSRTWNAFASVLLDDVVLSVNSRITIGWDVLMCHIVLLLIWIGLWNYLKP